MQGNPSHAQAIKVIVQATCKVIQVKSNAIQVTYKMIYVNNPSNIQ